ncbi:MAG: sigma 54-interacting transcriptional regulator [Candidatus Hydrogenedentes bacterium]|nr:sigma 54-interacting transcriptional regulator [Candidatus Hydrogenedentota bacterium]
MFWVTARLGTIRGISWRIGEQPLVFGRGLGCDVTIPDPLISRQHCVVHLDGGVPCVKDLGSSNCTLLNGRPVTEAKLQAGDEIAVGKTIFVVSLAEATLPADEATAGEPDTIQSPEDDVPHTPHYLDANPPMEGLDTIEDYVDLFRMCRNVGNASSIAQLLDIVRRELEPRIPCRCLCFCRSVGGGKLSVYERHADDAPLELVPPQELIERAFHDQHVLTVRLRGPFSPYTALAVPMTAGQERVGVFALCTLHNVLQRDDKALSYLRAVASQLAPLFHMIEQIEFFRSENERLRSGTADRTTLVGESPEIRKAQAQLREAARSGMPVLILGETGTGKELAARLIHDHSDRSARAFVVVNCAAVPPDLMESEFFGYEKGAFTGAMSRKLGRMEEAEGGTLFLDEIGDLSLENQARLLRAIENGTFYRVGGNREVQVDVRVVAATNKDIASSVRAGQFRADLYHRINGFTVELPPLRERPNDIPILADHFLRLTQEERSPTVRSFHPDAVKALMGWRWPGNVRELRNCIERACFLATDACIRAEDLRLPTGRAHEASAAGEPSLADLERKRIAEVLEKAGGNITLAAKMLGVSRPTVYRKLAEYAIQTPVR